MTVIWEGLFSAFKILFFDFMLPFGTSLGAFIWAFTNLHALLDLLVPFSRHIGRSDTVKRDK